MTEFVLDCFTTMGWCFEDQADEVSERALAAIEGGAAHVPAVWSLEVLNVLVVAERRGRLRESESARFLELLRALPIALDESATDWPRVDPTIAAARLHGLSAYDASYLELAMRLGVPLATRDQKLRMACKAAGVPLLA